MENISKEVLSSLYEKIINYKNEIETLYKKNVSEEILKNSINKLEEFQANITLFYMMIDDEHNFNKNHPLLSNDYFKDLLLKQFIFEEKYEICSKLV